MNKKSKVVEVNSLDFKQTLLKGQKFSRKIKKSKSMGANTTRISVSNCKSVTKNKTEKSKIKKATKMDDSRNATLKFFILKPLVI